MTARVTTHSDDCTDCCASRQRWSEGISLTYGSLHVRFRRRMFYTHSVEVCNHFTSHIGVGATTDEVLVRRYGHMSVLYPALSSSNSLHHAISMSINLKSYMKRMKETGMQGARLHHSPQRSR